MADVEQPTSGDAVERARKLLLHQLRVTLVSGRVFTGEFQALDKQGNLVLGHAVEHIGSDTRSVGMVLVPPKQRLSVEAKAHSLLAAL